MKTFTSFTLILLSFFPLTNSAQSLSKEDKAKQTGADQARVDYLQVGQTVADLLEDKIEILDKRTQSSDSPKDLKVFEDRIEFKIKDQNAAILFSDLADDPLPVPYFKKNKSILSLLNFDLISGGFNNSYKRLVELRQNLLLIQKDFKIKNEEAKKALFDQKVKEYRAMSVKPVVSEEQRKFIVQANLFSQQKNYVKAIELYTKVIDIDPVAYPAGYSNLALLCAQVNNFSAAISYMKKYLLLEPEASDARGAQDKIYEWEAMINK
jgi:tetratricopeptide (TPR) repeat protein